MSGRLVRLVALALCLWTTGLSAQTLPLPDNLTDLSSEQGEKFFFESGALQSYFAVADNFVTQKTQAYCGVASIVMVLNALHTPAPTTPEYQPYHTFTQDNLLDEHTDAILPREVLARQGMTLDQLGALLGLYPATIEVHHAEDGGLDAFRRQRARLSRRKGSLRARKLSAKGNRTGARWPYLAACGLRRQIGPVSDP